MSLIASLIPPSRVSSPTDRRTFTLTGDRAYQILAGGNASAAGVTVTRDTALTLSCVYRGVSLIANSVSKLPLVVRRNLPSDGSEPDTGHQAHWLLRRKANAHTTANTLISTLTGHAILGGGGYGWIKRDGAARPREILVLDPDSTYPVKERGRLFYITTAEVNGQRVRRRILPENVLHIRGFSPDALDGYSVFDLARQQIGLEIGTVRYSAAFYRNNAKPSLVIEVPGRLTEETIKAYRENWDDTHARLENAHKPAFMQSGSKLHELSSNARDSQLIEGREFGVRDLANWLSVPPHKLGDASRTAYNSLEQENQSFLDDSLDPWLNTWEQECWDKLLTEDEKRSDSHSIKFTRQALLRADAATRSTFYSSMVGIGVMLKNEVRVLEDMNPIEGLDDEPEPEPEPAPFGDDEGGDEPEPEEDEENSARSYALERLLSRTIERHCKQLTARAIAASKKPDKFTDWIDGIRGYTCGALADSLFDVIGAIETHPIHRDALIEHVSDVFYDTWHDELLDATDVTPDRLVEKVLIQTNLIRNDLPKLITAIAFGDSNERKTIPTAEPSLCTT